MGVDLSLLPFWSESMPDSGLTFSHSILELDRWSSLWEPISAIEKEHGQRVPDGFTSYLGRDFEDDDGVTKYGETTETPYGEPLMWVAAKYLKPLVTRKEVVGSYGNRAVWAYLQELPDELGIALFWH